MSGAAVEIGRAGPGDVARVRAVRLRALTENPDAFWTTLDEAAAMPTGEWRRRLADPDGATFLAARDGLDLGMAFGGPHHDVTGEAGLYGMWVAPEARRLGAARALITAVIGWARDAGYPRLRLEVGDANAAAVGTYVALGFEPTGRAGAMPAPREHITEHELALELVTGGC